METINEFNPFTKYIDFPCLSPNQGSGSELAKMTLEKESESMPFGEVTPNTSLMLPACPGRCLDFDLLEPEKTRPDSEWASETTRIGWASMLPPRPSEKSNFKPQRSVVKTSPRCVHTSTSASFNVATAATTEPFRWSTPRGRHGLSWTSDEVENLCELMTAAAKVPSNDHRLPENDARRPFCNFCRTNGETAQVYRTHSLRDQSGRVICPVLRSFRCPICKSTGDNAHTVTYCPFGSGKATAMTASWTQRKSCGCLKAYPKKSCIHHIHKR